MGTALLYLFRLSKLGIFSLLNVVDYNYNKYYYYCNGNFHFIFKTFQLQTSPDKVVCKNNFKSIKLIRPEYDICSDLY